MRKLRNFFLYKKTIKKNIDFLKKENNLDVDWVYRLYKVYSFTEEDNKNIKIYGEKYVETVIKKEIKKIDETIIKLRLYELVGVYDIKPFPELKSIGMLIGFKGFNTSKVASILLWSIILGVFLLSGFLLLSNTGIILGLIGWITIFLLTRVFLLFKD